MNLSNFWTSSIAQQENFSGGRSKKSSIALWNPGASEYSDESSAVQIYSLIEPKTTYGVTITIGGNGEYALERFLGCLLLGIMPDEGLEEALFSLHDMLRFYRNECEPHHEVLEPNPIDGTIGSKKKRPDLVLT